ncbi:MAG: hypothetical protein GY841_15705 [FCB group bacterium]|nr:hypothetical protein [FCB group bacterium]
MKNKDQKRRVRVYKNTPYKSHLVCEAWFHRFYWSNEEDRLNHYDYGLCCVLEKEDGSPFVVSYSRVQFINALDGSETAPRIDPDKEQKKDLGTVSFRGAVKQWERGV